MDYGFFDYKYNIPNFTSDLFSTQHIVYIVLVFILGFTGCLLLRRMKRERVTLLLRILSVFAVVLEITKISWESYYDITTGRGFNVGGLLPLYTCSLYIYTLLAAAWGRGKARDCALSFLATVGLLCGGIGVVYCNGLNYYPFWTFGAFYSLYFHSAMFLTGLLLITTRFVELKYADALRSFVPVVLLSLIAIPADYILGADYMQVYSGGGVPLYEDLSAALAERGLRPIYTAIMLLTYIPMSALIITAVLAVRRLGASLTARKKADAPALQTEDGV